MAHDCHENNKSMVLEALKSPGNVHKEDLEGCPSALQKPTTSGVNIPWLGLTAATLAGLYDPGMISDHVKGSRLKGHPLGWWNLEVDSWIYGGWSFSALLALWNRPEIFDGSTGSLLKQLRARIWAEYAYKALHASSVKPERIRIEWEKVGVTDVRNDTCSKSDVRDGLYLHAPGNRCSKPPKKLDEGATWYHRNEWQSILSAALEWPGARRSKWQDTAFSTQALDLAFVTSTVEDKWCIEDIKQDLLGFIHDPSATTAEPLTRLLGCAKEGAPPYVTPPSTFLHSIWRGQDGSIRSVESKEKKVKQESFTCAEFDTGTGLAFRGKSTEIDRDPRGSLLIIWDGKEWKIQE
jgi:hypothetical protein